MFGSSGNQNSIDAAIASRQAIEAGGLPPAAEQRLRENASRQGTDKHIFSSNLSVNELLLTHQCGYEPLGQVMGCSVYHLGWVGYQNSGYGGLSNWQPASQEWTMLTEAHYEARRLAFGRLLQEAILLRADGVVGVRLELAGVDVTSGDIEFKAIGTAVRSTAARNAPPTASPFLSNLSGQDHWALRKAGMIPVGFVFGNCSWYQVSGWRAQMYGVNGFYNFELPEFTQGVYTARELAMERLQAEATAVGARGVIGARVQPLFRAVEVDCGNNVRRVDLLAQFTVFGTAIAWEVGREPDFEVGLNLPLA